jgi:hypothetical protein
MIKKKKKEAETHKAQSHNSLAREEVRDPKPPPNNFLSYIASEVKNKNNSALEHPTQKNERVRSEKKSNPKSYTEISQQETEESSELFLSTRLRYFSNSSHHDDLQ